METKILKIHKISRTRLVRAFRKLGFVEDFHTKDVTVLRQMNFPFDRLVIPNDREISVELVKLYLKDLTIDWDDFYTNFLLTS